MTSHLFPSRTNRIAAALFGTLAFAFPLFIYGYTGIDTTFPGGTLPRTFKTTGATGGNSAQTVADALTLTTRNDTPNVPGQRKWHRSTLFTDKGDYLWKDATEPVCFSFTLARSLSDGLTTDAIYFYLLGDNGRRAVTDPDYTKAAAIGLALFKDGRLQLVVKPATPDNPVGFTAYPRQTITDLPPAARTLGFVIENNRITLLVDGQKTGSPVSLRLLAPGFTQSSSLFLSSIGNPESGEQSVTFTSLNVGPLPSPPHE
ncbi:hypothetical protein OpiT1DRAFT_02188 [Opitutaceae bacterium TAV1]|nr:hypothetical protein OpiT1DRAFT_02188 [Opitutaceae bacterium TAV1]